MLLSPHISPSPAVSLRKLKQGLCINLEGWYGGDGREAQKAEDICTPVADAC